MALNKDELTALSANTAEELAEWIPKITPEDISALYDLEVVKEQPRAEVITLLMAETNNIPSETTTDKEAPAIPSAEVEEGPKVVSDLNKNKPFNMVWHNDNKCILQDKKIYNAVTNELIEELE